MLRAIRRFRPALEVLEHRLTPASIHWDGGGLDGLWSTAANWTNDTVPGPPDIAVIGPGYSVLGDLPNIAVDAISCSSPITFTGNLTIGGVQINSYINKPVTFYGELTLGGTLNLGDLMGGGGTFNADIHIAAGKELSLSAGTFSFYNGVEVDGDGFVKTYGFDTTTIIALGGGDVIMRNLTFSTKMTADSGGSLTIKNQMDFLRGKLEGAGTLVIQSGALNIAEPMDKTILGWNVENQATTNWTGGNLLTTGSVFTNKVAGVFNLQGSMQNWTATGGSFENQGTFNSSGMQHVMAIEFNSTNLVQVLSGMLTLSTGGDFANDVIIQAAASLMLGAGEFILNPALTIQGTGILIQGGADSVVFGTVTAANYELRSGSLRGTGTLRLTSSLNWVAGQMREQGVTEVGENATMTLTGNGARTINGRTLVSHGIINWTAGTTPLNVEAGATFVNRATMNVAAINNDARLERIGGPDPMLENYGTINKTGNGLFKIFYVEFIQHSSGRINVQAGNLLFDEIVEGYFRGPIDAAASSEVRFRRSANFGIHVFDPNTEDGPIELLTGAGWFVFANGAAMIIPETNRIDASNLELTGTDTSVQGLGTLAPHYLKWKGGVMQTDGAAGTASYGITEIAAGRRMEISGGGGDVRLSDRKLLIRGEAHWGAPGDNVQIRVTKNGLMQIDGGVFEIWNDGVITHENEGGTIELIADGLLRKNHSVGPTVIAIKINNNGGNVYVEGTLNCYGVTNNSGLVRVTGGSTLNNPGADVAEGLQVNGGTIEVQAMGTVTGFRNNYFVVAGGMLDLQGGTISCQNSEALLIEIAGYMRGTGTVTGKVTNNGFMDIAGWGTSGTLTINGDFQQSGTGRLRIDAWGYQNGQFDRLAISGTANLGGTLEGDWNGPSAPLPGQSFEFMTYANRVGDFATFLLDLGLGYYYEPNAGGQSYVLNTRQTP